MGSLVRRVSAFAARNRTAVVVGLVVAVTSSGTAAAVSVVLGGTNTSNNLTTFRSARNGTVLQVTNNNAGGGVNARGLGITVPSGRAPIAVNANAGKATNLNADMVDGLDASAFLPANGKANDADALDGIDSNGFVRGNGSASRGATVRPPDGSASHFFLGQSFNELNAVSPWVGLYYLCPTNLAHNGAVVMRNDGNETLNVFYDNGLTEPTYLQLTGNSQHSIATLAAGEHLSIQVQGAGMATFEVYSVHRPDNCHAQGQAWFAY